MYSASVSTLFRSVERSSRLRLSRRHHSALKPSVQFPSYCLRNRHAPPSCSDDALVCGKAARTRAWTVPSCCLAESQAPSSRSDDILVCGTTIGTQTPTVPSSCLTNSHALPFCYGDIWSVERRPGLELVLSHHPASHLATPLHSRTLSAMRNAFVSSTTHEYLRNGLIERR